MSNSWWPLAILMVRSRKFILEPPISSVNCMEGRNELIKFRNPCSWVSVPFHRHRTSSTYLYQYSTFWTSAWFELNMSSSRESMNMSAIIDANGEPIGRPSGSWKIRFLNWHMFGSRQTRRSEMSSSAAGGWILHFCSISWMRLMAGSMGTFVYKLVTSNETRRESWGMSWFLILSIRSNS